MINLTPQFYLLRDQTLENCDFDQQGLKDSIVTIYASLTKIHGFSDTGVSKIMHVMNDGLFVMWDKAIRENYHHKGKFPSGGDCYLNFLKEMQRKLPKSPTITGIWGSLVHHPNSFLGS